MGILLHKTYNSIKVTPRKPTYTFIHNKYITFIFNNIFLFIKYCIESALSHNCYFK